VDLYDLLTGWVPEAWADYRLLVATVLSIPLCLVPPLAIGFLIMRVQQWVEKRRLRRARAADPLSQYLPPSYVERCDHDCERAGWPRRFVQRFVSIFP
jgi:hypothetical protein